MLCMVTSSHTLVYLPHPRAQVSPLGGKSAQLVYQNPVSSSFDEILFQQWSENKAEIKQKLAVILASQTFSTAVSLGKKIARKFPLKVSLKCGEERHGDREA